MTPTHRPPTSVSMTCMLPLVGLLPLHIFGHTSECVACPSKHEESLSGPAHGSVEDVERSTIGSGGVALPELWESVQVKTLARPSMEGDAVWATPLPSPAMVCHSLLQSPRGAANLAQG